MDDNPFLSREVRPPFDRMSAESLADGVTEAIDRAERDLQGLVDSTEPRTFETTLLALDELVERVSRAFGFARHLAQVDSTPEVRAAYNAVLPSYSAFMAKLPTHPGLWRLIQDYAASDEARGLRGVRRRHLEKTVREFRRAGADLPAEQRQRAQELRIELSRLSTRFGENVLDATNAFEMILTDEAELEGLPAGVIARARADAEARGQQGWRFTLQAPSYRPFMRLAAARQRRRQMYQAHAGRAAAGDYDNRPIIRRILSARRELARLLGFENFAELTLQERMIKSGAQAQAFERDLAARTLPHFQRDIAELERFASAELGLDRIEPWDLAYVAEALRRRRYDFDEEALRPYFALDAVLEGMFAIAERLFGVRVVPVPGVPTWHPQVRVHDLIDDGGTRLGSVYLDLHPRESKREGAWMNPMVTGGPLPSGARGTVDGEASVFAPHLGMIAANVTPPAEGEPALLTHDEVTTLFHEFGHLLHHALGRVEVPARGGLGSVAWDFVELPSQLMENWAWEREGLDLVARHQESGEPIPEELFRALATSRTFLGASAQMRQLSLGIVDLALHIDFDPDLGGDPIAFGQHVMEPFVLRPEFAHTQFLASFSHIFASGYAAGYYSYKWSEVLDADVFSRFQDEGIFDPRTGRDLVDAVLSRGDSEDPAVLFRRFIGRDPDPAALMRRNIGGEAA